MLEAMPRKSYDLVVLGAGTAGIPCAVEAARAGARVALVEKGDEIGGTLHVSGGHLSAAGARRQRRRGIDDSPDRHFDDIVRISGGTARRDLVRLAVDGAAETVDWLEDHGFAFAAECPRLVYGHEPYSVARTFYGPDEARSILAVLRPLMEEEQRRGGLEVLLETRATEILTEEDAVVGVSVRGPRGEGELGARDVVLASGGFASSPELFARLHRRPLVSAASPLSRGEGLEMARRLGARIAGREKYLPTFGGLPEPGDPGRTRWHDRPLLVAAERRPWEIYVDRSGRRFVAEDTRSVHFKEEALAELEDLTFFLVLDDRAVEESEDIIVGWSPEKLRALSGARPGFFVASSIPELARRAGIEARGLEASVDAYNGALEADLPDPLGRRVRPAPIRRAPYYAIQNHGISLITFAGLDVDDRLRVRRSDGTVIPGLYGAGEVLGAGATCGRSFCGGMMLTPALTFGRLLGQRLGQAATGRQGGQEG